MIPRLKSSNKWTDFPKEYLNQIKDVFSQGFAKNLKNHKLIVQGRIYPSELILRVGCLEQGRLMQANFEVSVGYDAKKQNILDCIHTGVDAAASMMQEYFEKQGHVDFPRQWKEYDFNQTKVYLQFSTVNTDLEAQANELLGENFGDLVVETTLDEDALDRAEESIESKSTDQDQNEDELLEDSDEDLENQGPTLFSNKKKLH